ncbi:MAG TPA: uracil-DNA glycosylase family protein [Verrucomicrobiae bacterium]
MSDNSIQLLLRAAKKLTAALDPKALRVPVCCTYNPLEYAWAGHEKYLRAYAQGPKRVLFLGMNPGPFGMAQTGVPFGEVAAVRDWMKINETILKPSLDHPKRPVLGFACPRSEVSGQRLWGLFAQRFPLANDFFAEHFVVNYCPLIFFSETGSNITPDKLPTDVIKPILAACDEHLQTVVEVLRPEWLVGVGDFAEKRARMIFPGTIPRIGKILHPSPASPAANRDWGGAAMEQLRRLGIWS